MIDPTLPQQSADQRPMATVLPQALPTAVLQQQPDDTLNPAQPTPSTIKEQGPAFNVDQSMELPVGVQSIEELRTPEIPVEVEKFIQEVKDDEQSVPQEVVIADQTQLTQPAPTLAKPVIVLPMSEQEFRQSKKEPVSSSKRWLGEWIDKITKIFMGEVVFRENQGEQEDPSNKT